MNSSWMCGSKFDFLKLVCYVVWSWTLFRQVWIPLSGSTFKEAEILLNIEPLCAIKYITSICWLVCLFWCSLFRHSCHLICAHMEASIAIPWILILPHSGSTFNEVESFLNIEPLCAIKYVISICWLVCLFWYSQFRHLCRLLCPHGC